VKLIINPAYPTNSVRLPDGRIIDKGETLVVSKKEAEELLAWRGRNLPIWVDAEYDQESVDGDADNAESTDETVLTTDGEE